MAIATPTRQRHSATIRVQRPPRARPERSPADARAQEARARRALAQAFARIERTYALAVRNLEEFDAYLNGVHRRLQKA